MAQAVKALWPDVKLGIGPSIDDGFYYDFDKAEPFEPEDLERIEEKMNEIIQSDYKFERSELAKEEAVKLFKKRGEKYKIELIKEIPEENVSIYKDGNFVDLCRGPHIESTGQVRAFKLLSIAGAYWHGIETNPTGITLAVELLRGGAAGYQRMKSRDGAAGDHNEHHRPD